MSNWITKDKDGNSISIPIPKMTNTHLKKAYWWACKRYTKYHNEIVKEDNTHFRTYMLLYQKLREMEEIAICKDIALNVPPIDLIKNDNKYYWRSPVVS